MAKKATYVCSGCGEHNIQTDKPGPVICPRCAAQIGFHTIKVEGTSYWQVLLVIGGLIVLVFALAALWKVIFNA